MRTNCKIAGLLAGLSLLLVAFGAQAAAEGPRRAAALLEYIANDYGRAVEDGEVVNQAEYEEQVEFVGTVRTLLADQAPPAGITTGLDRLEAAIRARSPAPEVAARAKDVRRQILETYAIAQAPAGPPDAEQGARIYAERCASCHAADGSGQTPTAAAFAVKPPDFRDRDGALARSPFGVFNTVTFGLAGTPMPSFAQLPESERWDVAFHVQSLAHGGPRPDAPALAGVDASLASVATLAASTDGELRARIGPDADRVLSWLRTTAPYRGPAGGLAVARAHLARAEKALAEGDRDAARLATLDAYLEGFETVEARVSAVDPALVGEIEQGFARARQAIEEGGDAKAAIAELYLLLDRVDAALAGGGSWASLFVASAIILLREGLEVVLLIGVLLTVLVKLGRPEMRRWIHWGWMAALAAGGVTWVVAGQLLAMSGRSRELLEGIVALIAATVLLFVGHWFVSAAEKKKWMGFLRGKVAAHLGAGRVLPLFGLSFLAVYREAFETVLFYQALLLDSPAGASPILAGLGAGLVGVAIFGWLILRAGRKLPLGPLFTASGLVLCALCVVFVGQGLQALREAGAISPHPLHMPAIPWLGIYPDLVGLLVQAAVIALIAGLVLVPRLRAPVERPA